MGEKSWNFVSNELKGLKNFPSVWWLSMEALDPRCLGLLSL